MVIELHTQVCKNALPALQQAEIDDYVREACAEMLVREDALRGFMKACVNFMNTYVERCRKEDHSEELCEAAKELSAGATAYLEALC